MPVADRGSFAKHLKNIFESGELDEEAVLSIMETTAADGKSYRTRYYNLDAIIAVGYRVNSFEATRFRIWATRTLKEFITNFHRCSIRRRSARTLRTCRPY